VNHVIVFYPSSIGVVHRSESVTGGEERFIVYDYMPNHNLLTHLHPKRAPTSQQHQPLDWPRRIAIAIRAAEGLA
jgi:hypothetical protein